ATDCTVRTVSRGATRREERSWQGGKETIGVKLRLTPSGLLNSISYRRGNGACRVHVLSVGLAIPARRADGRLKESSLYLSYRAMQGAGSDFGQVSNFGGDGGNESGAGLRRQGFRCAHQHL